MANPRKFSDKLEIIRRKEEEANAAFVKIMREVSDARTGKSPQLPHPTNSWQLPIQNDYINMRQKFKGGSMPNVNLSGQPMIQNVYASGVSNEMYLGTQHSSQGQQYVGINTPHGRREQPSGPIFPSKNKRSYTVTAPYRSNMLHQTPPQSVINEQNDSHSMWRRTYSDSAIQQTLQQPPKQNPEGSTVQRVTNEESHTYHHAQNSPPISLPYNENNNSKSHMQMQANTSSLPDLSNLSIPSPIQNPIDVDEGKTSISQSDSVNPFQIPCRPAPRRVGSVGKQLYPRQLASNPDVIESLQRENHKQLHLNTYNANIHSLQRDKNESTMTVSSISQSAPLSPVTPPPYYWNSTPMSPLATRDLMQSSQQTDLQQQLQQFQLQSESSPGGTNGMVNPPPYPYINESENYNNYFSNTQFSSKQSLYRMSSGPAQLSGCRLDTCDQELDSALMKVKARDNRQFSETDLHCVGVSLAPLDYNEMQILNENAELVDQSAEEQFRLERATYQ